MKKYIVGVDVGGTNVKLGLVSDDGVVLDRMHFETKKFIQDKTYLMEAIINSIESLVKKNQLKKRQILGIGFGLPGLVDFEKGVVNFLPNIPGWKNVPLKKIIEKRLKIPTFVDNDVNVITLGEWRFGAGRGFKNLVCITLGTGVGGGLIFNNDLYRGEGFVAGEVGHMPLREDGLACSCGGWGCFERYVGNRYLLKVLQKTFRDPSMQLPDSSRLAALKDKKALKFWNDVGTQIGNGLIGLINLLNPRLIIIGGGVSNNFKHFHKQVESVIQKRAMKVQAKMVRIVHAQLGDDAGILGAQVLVKHAIL